MTQHTVRIWDLPTRIFHWALAVCIVALVITANVGGNAMVWHFRLGYTVLALLVFRLVWGLVGGRWSRFSAPPSSPSGVPGRRRARLSGQAISALFPTLMISIPARTNVISI